MWNCTNLWLTLRERRGTLGNRRFCRDSMVVVVSSFPTTFPDNIFLLHPTQLPATSLFRILCERRTFGPHEADSCKAANESPQYFCGGAAPIHPICGSGDWPKGAEFAAVFHLGSGRAAASLPPGPTHSGELCKFMGTGYECARQHDSVGAPLSTLQQPI